MTIDEMVQHVQTLLTGDEELSNHADEYARHELGITDLGPDDLSDNPMYWVHTSQYYQTVVSRAIGQMVQIKET